MTIKLQLKRSAVKNKIPTPADLDYGEIGINYHKDSVALYAKLTDNTIKELTACNQATMQYMGVADPAAAMPLAPASLRAGMIYVLSPAGRAATSWTGIAGVDVADGQMAAWEGTKWELFGSQSLPDATETVKGIAEIATQAEVNAGTDDSRIVTPAKLKSYVADQLKATWLPGDHIPADGIGTSTWNGTADTLTATGSVEVKIAAGGWGTGGAVAPAEQVQVRWKAGDVSSAAHGATLTGRVQNASGNVGVDYSTTVDKLPGAITIPAGTNAAPSAPIDSSASSAVTGITAAVRLWLKSTNGTAAQVSIAGGTWVNIPTTPTAGLAITAGQTFQLRHTTQAGASTVTTTDVYVGWDATSSVVASYATTNAATRVPDVGTVTLSDVAGGARFTSTAFPVSATMTEDGTPKSDKKLKAYVEGALKSAAVTSAITKATVTSSPVWSSYFAPKMGQSPSTSAFNGIVGTNAFYASASASATWTPPTPIAFKKLVVYGGLHTTLSDGAITVNGVDLTNQFPAADMTVVGTSPIDLTAFVTSPLTSITITSRAAGYGFALAGIEIDGALLIDGSSEVALEFADGTGLLNFANGDAVTEVGNGDEGTGTVVSVNPTGLSMVLRPFAGTWDVGSQVKGPLKPPAGGATVKLYCKLNAAGAVSDLQSADPGFTAWTPAGTGPYTGSITWPATLPTGQPPDTDLPAGTSLTVEVEASNTAGSDSAQSNTIVPA